MKHQEAIFFPMPPHVLSDFVVVLLTGLETSDKIHRTCHVVNFA